MFTSLPSDIQVGSSYHEQRWQISSLLPLLHVHVTTSSPQSAHPGGAPSLLPRKSNSTRVNGLQGRFGLDMKNSSFIGWTVRLPRAVVKSPTSEGFKVCVDMAHGTCFSGGLGRTYIWTQWSSRSFPTYMILSLSTFQVLNPESIKKLSQYFSFQLTTFLAKDSTGNVGKKVLKITQFWNFGMLISHQPWYLPQSTKGTYW